MLENVSLAVHRLGCMTTGISLLFVIGTNSGQQHLNHHVNRPYDIDIRPYKIDIKQYHPGDIWQVVVCVCVMIYIHDRHPYVTACLYLSYYIVARISVTLSIAIGGAYNWHDDINELLSEGTISNNIQHSIW